MTAGTMQISCPDPFEINTIVEGSVSLKELLPHSTSGILDVDFDPLLLKLENASVK